MALPDPDAGVVTRVTSLVAASSRPVLTGDDVKASIMAHPKVDQYGVYADQEGWEATWDTYAAVAELWGIKAGRVAGDFNFQADGGSFSKGDVIAHCLAMEAKYAAMVGGSVSTLAERDPLTNVVVNG